MCKPKRAPIQVFNRREPRVQGPCTIRARSSELFRYTRALTRMWKHRPQVRARHTSSSPINSSPSVVELSGIARARKTASQRNTLYNRTRQRTTSMYIELGTRQMELRILSSSLSGYWTSPYVHARKTNFSLDAHAHAHNAFACACTHTCLRIPGCTPCTHWCTAYVNFL